MAICLYKSKGEKAVESASSVGKREYPHCISSRKAILPHLPRERVEIIVEHNGLPEFTPQTITERGSTEPFARFERPLPLRR